MLRFDGLAPSLRAKQSKPGVAGRPAASDRRVSLGLLAITVPCERSTLACGAVKTAKRNRGQAIENTRFGEIADSAPSMISMTCGHGCETIHFAPLNEALCFYGVFLAERNVRRALRLPRLGR